MKRILSILAMLTLVTVATIGFLAWYQFDNFLKKAVSINEQNAIFEVKTGSNIRQVSDQLEVKGIIKNSWFFFALARLTDQADKLKAGEYQLEIGMKPEDVLQRLISGQTLQYQLTIIDGKTFKDIRESVKNHPTLVKTLADADYSNIMQKLGGAVGSSPEGWFFPDTYNFPRKTTDLEFLQRSYKEMQTYLNKAWEKREPNPYLKTPYDALILASIVEKETGLPEERPLIARVFLNRLAKNMLLQTDPTVIYGMGDKYAGNIRKTDLQTDTPYNTYTRAGLPPTPIATPSKAAIDAVLHPAKSNVLYFVATAPGAASHFSETLEEHNRAVQQYILNRDKAKEQATP